MTQSPQKIITLSPFRAFLGIAIIAIALIDLSIHEIHLGKLLTPKYDIIKEAYLLPSDKKVSKAYNRDVVLLQSSSVSSNPGYAPMDHSFDIRLGTQLELHRIVEYCQWHEQQSTNQTEPIYYKDWSSELIDSSKFKIKEGHENNLRNPFPKRDVVPRYVDAGAFHISYAFIDNLNIPTIRYQYQNDSTTRPPFATLQNGFYYATDYWIYSKIDMEGIGEPIKLDGLQWVTPEEEEDLETNCKPGDIRVGYEYKECPRVITVVGIQNDDLILPIKRVSGTFAISAPMNTTAEGLLDTLEEEESNELVMIRCFSGLAVFCGMFIMVGNYTPFRYVPHFVRCAITAVLSIYVVCLSIWVYYYGFENGFVIKTGLWFVSHLVLSILLNVMFYMIRLYRFALRLEKEKKSE